MTTTPDPGVRGGGRARLGWIVALAWTVLWAERLWPLIWPAVALTGLMAALMLFDVLPLLAGWLHVAVLVAWVVAVGGVAIGAVVRLKPPTRHEAERRVERDSGLAHRPLTAARDGQALGAADVESRRLWRLHQRRQRGRLARLRLALPTFSLVEHDPWALRGIVILVLATALAVGGGDWAGRLDRALTPQFAVAAPGPPPVLDLYLSPPAYTGRAPILLAAGLPVTDAAPLAAGDSVVVPAGSEVIARLARPAGAVSLQLDDTLIPFDAAADGSRAELSHTLAAEQRLAVLDDGREIAHWPIKPLIDQPPEAHLADPPAVSRRGTVGLDWQASDDYGLSALAAVITLDAGAAGALDRTPLRLDLALPPGGSDTAEGIAFRDLTPHPWAGQPVQIVLEAADAAGQTGRSNTVSLVLPERSFDHPIARAIIDQRRRLLLAPAEAWVEVAETLATLRLRPERFDDKAAVYLALVAAAERLVLAPPADAATVAAVEALLWDTALAIEHGELSLAERDLRAAQQALREALASGASDEEIRRLMDELRQAMDAYLDAVQRQMLERMAEGEELPLLPPDAELIDRAQMQDYLSRMQELAEMGARDEAMAMLDQLQAMMESLEGGYAAAPEGAGEAMELLQDIQALMRAQQELRDQTFRDSQRLPWEDGQPGQSGQPGGEGAGAGGPGSPTQAEQVQEGLRRALGDAMRRMGEMVGDIPPGLGEAEQAMRRAAEALGRGAPGEATDPQGEALEGLSEGLQGFVDAMREQMGERAFGTGMQSLGPNRDPLGRRTGPQGGFGTEGVELPDQRSIERVREIVDELRRRLDQRDRPDLERRYFERLLERF